MSNHSPKVFLNTPEFDPIGTVKGTDGLWRVAVTTNGAANSPVSPSIDAFGRNRVSFPSSLFDSKQVYDNQPLLFTEYTAGSGTVLYTQNRSSTRLFSGTGATGRALRQTKRYFNYQPGKSTQVFMTYCFQGAETNVSKRVGYYDDQNGIYLELNKVGDTAVYSVVQRSYVGGSLSTTTVVQSDWNVDRLDGTGPSGKTLDPTKAIILSIDFEWLGVGQVRVGFDFGGETVYAHRFAHSNAVMGVYMQTPNLPVRWEIQNTGVATNTPVMEAFCCSVQSEGGLNPLSVQRTVSRGAVGASISTSPQTVLALRLKSAYNRATVFPLNSAAVTTDTGVNYLGQLILNPTYASALTWTPINNSSIEYSTSVVGANNGTILSEFYGISGAPGRSGGAAITTTADLNSVLALASDYAGTQDTVALVIRTLTGTSASSMYAQIDWLEIL